MTRDEEDVLLRANGWIPGTNYAGLWPSPLVKWFSWDWRREFWSEREAVLERLKFTRKSR